MAQWQLELKIKMKNKLSDFLVHCPQSTVAGQCLRPIYQSGLWTSDFGLRTLCTIFLILAIARAAPAQSPLAISVDTKLPGVAISPDFTGLSFELTQLLPGPDGLHYFRPGNYRLISLFQTLGIKNLRVGGNTSDRNWRRPPDPADIDSLFAFAKAADVKIIYCLRLHNGDPGYDARTAKYIMDHYPDQVACFSSGQEPTA
jgi:hypothetical protein